MTMKNRLVMLTLGFIIMFPGCREQTTLTPEQKELIIKEVKALSHQFWVSTNQNNDEKSLQKFMGFFDETCDRIWQAEPVAWKI
jgi:hypothetical protein